MEKIVRIEEFSGSIGKEIRYNPNCDGYRIITDKQTIALGIDNGQCCCEHWGYLMSEDDLSRFEGAELIGITLTDTSLNTKSIPEVYEGGIMFVNIQTDRGMLQFVAYNEHNGYYGHTAYVISEQLQHQETL